jgi:hypothetical protein
MHLKIKSRRLVLHKIVVTMCGGTLRSILVTPVQLANLNRVTVGTEFFLSRRYCYSADAFWVIRTKDGLQYMPNPHHGSANDAHLLESLLYGNQHGVD